MAGALQPLAQLAVVVDLAVEDHDRLAVLAEDRLVAGGQVDDAQALDAEPDAGVAVDAPGVGPPVLDGLAHGLHRGGSHGDAVAASLASDATHSGVSVSCRPVP